MSIYYMDNIVAGTPKDDIEVITSGLTVSNATLSMYQFTRVGKAVYYMIEGTWKGSATSSTQDFISGLPSSFRPTKSITTSPITAYATSSPFVRLGRTLVNPEGSFKVGESDISYGLEIRGAGVYYII